LNEAEQHAPRPIGVTPSRAVGHCAGIVLGALLARAAEIDLVSFRRSHRRCDAAHLDTERGHRRGRIASEHEHRVPRVGRIDRDVQLLECVFDQHRRVGHDDLATGAVDRDSGAQDDLLIVGVVGGFFRRRLEHETVSDPPQMQVALVARELSARVRRARLEVGGAEDLTFVEARSFDERAHCGAALSIFAASSS
jgi:hypothetical protein